jgi:hypothetical protein
MGSNFTGDMYVFIHLGEGAGGSVYKSLARDPTHCPRNLTERLQIRVKELLVFFSFSTSCSGGLFRSLGGAYLPSTALIVLHFLNVFV